MSSRARSEPSTRSSETDRTIRKKQEKRVLRPPRGREPPLPQQQQQQQQQQHQQHQQHQHHHHQQQQQHRQQHQQQEYQQQPQRQQHQQQQQPHYYFPPQQPMQPYVVPGMPLPPPMYGGMMYPPPHPYGYPPPAYHPYLRHPPAPAPAPLPARAPTRAPAPTPAMLDDSDVINRWLEAADQRAGQDEQRDDAAPFSPFSTQHGDWRRRMCKALVEPESLAELEKDRGGVVVESEERVIDFGYVRWGDAKSSTLLIRNNSQNDLLMRVCIFPRKSSLSLWYRPHAGDKNTSDSSGVDGDGDDRSNHSDNMSDVEEWLWPASSMYPTHDHLLACRGGAIELQVRCSAEDDALCGVVHQFLCFNFESRLRGNLLFSSFSTFTIGRKVNAVITSQAMDDLLSAESREYVPAEHRRVFLMPPSTTLAASSRPDIPQAVLRARAACPAAFAFTQPLDDLLVELRNSRLSDDPLVAQQRVRARIKEFVDRATNDLSQKNGGMSAFQRSLTSHGLLLRVEQVERAFRRDESSLYSVHLINPQKPDSPTLRCFPRISVHIVVFVHVPGVDEGRPALRLGSRVQLRPVVSTDVQFEGCVYGVEGGYVVLHIPPVHEMIAIMLGSGKLGADDPHFSADPELFLEKTLFHVFFPSEDIDHNFFVMLHCLSALISPDPHSSAAAAMPGSPATATPIAGDDMRRFERLLKSASISPDRLQHLEDDIAMQIPGDDKLELFHPVLNEQQREVVKQVLARDALFRCRSDWVTPPFVVCGPPGTGKSMCVAEMVLQLVRQNVARGETQRRILVCTPSEYASDVLLERLAPRLDPETLIRVNHPTRHTPLNPALRRYAPEMNKDGIHAIPDVEELAKRQVIVTTCMNVAFLKCPRKFFATLILDEAGQAFYAEACIPLATLGGGANVVIVGDTKQLGAHVESPFCELRGLGVSLQEELLRQPLYQCHRRGHHNDEGRVARHVVQLLESYRAHPELMEFFSQQWYDSSLVARPDPSECDLFVGWEKLPNRRVPLLFRGVRGEDRYSPESESLDNPLESLEVVRVVVDLLGSGRAIQAGEISVIAPFRRQVMTIRRALRLQGLHDVVVETVDAYQGRESLCVIFSTTLSRPASNLPVKLLLNLTNEKRLNVALSRAKAFQCVIGDPYALLGACSMWRDFLLFCYRRNAYVGCPLPPLATLQGLGPRLLKSKPPSPVIAADDVSRAIARSLGWEKEEGGNNVDNDDDDDDDGDGNDIATDAGVDNDGIGAFPQEYVASAALGGAIRLNDYLAGDDDLITGPRRLI